MCPQDRFLDRLDPDDFDRAWQIFCKLREIENQFNSLQTDYRKLASTWLLATFAAIGFVLSTKVDWGVDSHVVCALIGLAGGVGIWLLWSVDLMVYQQLRDAVFIWGVKIEERCTQLPPVRRTMMLTQIGGDVRLRIIWYYIVGVSIPWLIALASLALWTMHPVGSLSGANEVREWVGLALPAGLVAIGAAALHLWRSSTSRLERLQRELLDNGLL